VKEENISNATPVAQYISPNHYVAALPCEITDTFKYDANLEK